MNLHNTLSGRVEPFAPAEAGEVRMYVCGPTVYGRAHIGNFRSFVATDLLRRTLRYKGWRVKEVMNLTDVDDKIIHFASQAGKDLRSFTEPHIRSFDEDRATLRMESPELVPRATAHIPDMIGLVQKLVDRGHTYAADGSVYFKISTFPGYGRLSRLDVAGIRRLVIKNELVPVICGAAFKNKGVQPLLDSVIDYLPSPIDIPDIQGSDPEKIPMSDRIVTQIIPVRFVVQAVSDLLERLGLGDRASLSDPRPHNIRWLELLFGAL